MNSIEELLTECGLGHYADVFEAHEIDLDILGDLGDADFRELGLPIGPRRKLQRAILQLQLREPSTNSATQAERRHLTVLFCDLADSTAIAERLDPEEMSDILRRYQNVCTDAIGELGGTIAKFMGDGVLAYFGYPMAHEDDAQRSIDAALAIVDQARSWKALHDIQCVVRIGIATGTVVVGETIGSESSQEQVAVGDTLNLAARLEGIAGANGIAIAERTRQLVGDLFDLDDRGLHVLKGFSAPQQVWGVAARSSLTRFRSREAGRPPMVGRDRELARLLEIWHDVEATSASRLVIDGAAGIGKSRLVDELRRSVTPRSTLTLQCAEPYSTTPYWPVTRWLSDISPSTAPTVDELTSNLGLEPVLAVCVASLWAHSDDMGPLFPAHPALVRERTLDGLGQLVVSAISDGPALLVVEDTQWADPSTLELLDRVAARTTVPLLIVETTREHDAVRDCPTLELGRLGGDDIMVLVGALTSDLTLDPASARQIGERADGNPYFIEQLVEYARTLGANDEGIDVVPESLHDTLMARLDLLPRSRDFLLAAAVIGTSFDTELVAAALGVSPDQVQPALGDALAAGLIAADSRRRGVFGFTQPLLRDTAYQSLIRERRAGYHRRIARAMVDAGRDMDRPELVARHFTLANEHSEALGRWERAADLAIGRSASAEAAAHLHAALGALGAVTDIADRTERELGLHLLLGARLLAIQGFAALDVEVVYSRAMELCAAMKDGAERLAAFWGLWGFHVVRADLDEAAELAHGFDELADRLAHGPARVAAAYARGVTSFYRGDLDAAESTFRVALARYDVAHRRESLLQYGLDLAVSVTAYLGWVLALRGRRLEAEQAAQRAIAIGHEADDPFSLAFATTFAAQTYLFLEQFPEAREHAVATKEMSFVHGYAQWQGQADIQLGHIDARTSGSIAIEPMQHGLDKYISTGATLALPYTRAWLAEALRDSGELERAAAMVRQGLDETASCGERYYDAELLRLSGEIAGLLGDEATAVAQLERARSLARSQGATLLESRINDARPLRDNTTEGDHG